MKKSKDYRKLFKAYYGIEFSKKYQVHHIDLNRENNAISNLMLLPASLHHRYHFYISATTSRAGEHPYERVLDMRICGNYIDGRSYAFGMFEDMLETLKECSKWYDYKMYLDGVIPNIHGIVLEE